MCVCIYIYSGNKKHELKKKNIKKFIQKYGVFSLQGKCIYHLTFYENNFAQFKLSLQNSISLSSCNKL